MSVLPYIVVGGIVFYYLYDNYHPDKTTVPDIDLKQDIKKQQENIPLISEETNFGQKQVPIPNVAYKNVYDNNRDDVTNPLLNQIKKNTNVYPLQTPPIFSNVSSRNMMSSRFKSIDRSSVFNRSHLPFKTNYIVAKF